MGKPPLHRARKRFGQNFLTDSSVIAAIVAGIAPAEHDNMVEIGPGLGALTRPLLAAVRQLHAIELDRDLIQRLQELPQADKLLLYNQDALGFDFCKLAAETNADAASGSRLRIVGNLPYNISSPLLFHLLKSRHSIHDMHFMLQKEVVDRIAAEPGSRTYGRLSVMMQYYCCTEVLLAVPPQAFSPAPKVQSAVLRLRPRAAEQTDAVPFEALQKVVQLAFAARRKTLRNNFRSWLSARQLDDAGFNSGDRAETLDPGQFVALTGLWLEHNDLPGPSPRNP